MTDALSQLFASDSSTMASERYGPEPKAPTEEDRMQERTLTERRSRRERQSQGRAGTVLGNRGTD